MGSRILVELLASEVDILIISTNCFHAQPQILVLSFFPRSCGALVLSIIIMAILLYLLSHVAVITKVSGYRGLRSPPYRRLLLLIIVTLFTTSTLPWI